MIIPALIPKSLEDLKQQLERVAFASEVQIDLVDGKFVPFSSWPYEPSGKAEEAKEILQNHKFEMDLMVSDADDAALKWSAAGATRLIFHLESLSDPNAIIETFADNNVEVFFSINNDTPLEGLYPYINQIDGVQLMGINEIGRQGQPFDNRVLERIASLRALFPDLTISVDGGVNKDTILSLSQAGANRFVVGSAILKSDNPEATYQELLKIIKPS